MIAGFRNRSFLENRNISYISIYSIDPNPAQPRKTFLQEGLRDLAESIRENGVIQPITVRKSGLRYILVAGERRLRAAKMAGLDHIPCIVSNIDEKQSSLIALVENLQRCDLDFFEEAQGIALLIKNYGFSQEEAAKKLGKSQSAIANKLRLLRLDSTIVDLIRHSRLTERHARALLRIEDENDRFEVLTNIIALNLNVSQTDEYVDRFLAGNTLKKTPQKKGKSRFIFKDVRLFLNTINHAVDTMRKSGIIAEMQKTEDDSGIHMTINISKTAKN